KAVADHAPDFMNASLQAATGYLVLSRPNDAIAQLERYKRLNNVAPEAQNLLVQAHLQQQLSLATNERNWSEFATALGQAQQKLPNRPELLIAEALYRHSLGTDSDDRFAKEQLHRIETIEPVDSALLAQIAICYQQIGAPSDATRVLEQI